MFGVSINQLLSMLIGGKFNSVCRQILLGMGVLAEMEPGKPVSVQELNKNLHFDRVEMRRHIEYLDEQDYIDLSTIGGPFLYGHISLTKKGVHKLKELSRR